MSGHLLGNILPLVTGPSRYLGTEINSVKKAPGEVKLRFALAFPDLYEIGTSHFGLQILYTILNREPDIAAERVFAPALDMEDALRSREIPLCSLESGLPLKDFGILGFSLLYELNYTNVLAMLDLAGIPFRACDRDSSFPFVVAGGPCTCNPEPLADFFDAFVFGDGESAAVEIAREWIKWNDAGEKDKESLLSSLSGIEGVYIPSFYRAEQDRNGFEHVKASAGAPFPVRRAIVPDLDEAFFPDRPVVPYGRPVHDRLRIEVARGCSRGCRFCQAGMIYRPVRERSLSCIAGLTEKALASTGYEDISLLSLSTGDYSCLTGLMENLIYKHSRDPVAVSIPSFRAGTLSPEMMSLVKSVRKTGFTIAPEAGTERLRRVINKNISEEEILDTAWHAFSLGWQTIKLYFMIGLPTETWADIEAIVDLVEKIRRKKKEAGGRKSRINVSVAAFIPKPHTPFQWLPQLTVEKAESVIDYLRDRLRRPGISFKWQSPEMSWIEGLWARGDRRFSKLLETAYRKGCRFDGWSDTFDFRMWLDSCSASGIDPSFFLERHRDRDEPFPWDVVDSGVSRQFLFGELEKAYSEASTPDCRSGLCNQCGVCDFEKVRPRLASEKSSASREDSGSRRPAGESGIEKRIRMRYAKKGPAGFFSHLELINIFVRALRRAGVHMKYTRGFHPKPRVSFHDALPVGVESLGEDFYLSVEGVFDCSAKVSEINSQLPEGLELLECSEVQLKSGPVPEDRGYYRVYLRQGIFDDACIDRFLRAESWPSRRFGAKKPPQDVDLKEAVLGIRKESSDCLLLCLSSLPGRKVRPGQVVQEIFGLCRERASLLRVVKCPDEDY